MGSETSDYESDSEKPIKASTATLNLQIKNYLFDNKNLKTLDVKTDDLKNGLVDSDEEVFLVTCPKSINLSNLKGQNLKELRDESEKVDFGFSVDHLKKSTPFTVFVPKTGAPDTLQLIKPVGKISIFKKFTVPKIEANVCAETPMEVSSPTSKKQKKKKRQISESSDTKEVVVKEEPKTPIKSSKKKRNSECSPMPTKVEVKEEIETPTKKSKKQPPAELSWLVEM